MAGSPGLQGKLVIQFVISPDGSVSSAKTKAATLESEALESCVNWRFTLFEFPAPEAKVRVNYPLIFAPG